MALVGPPGAAALIPAAMAAPATAEAGH
jgi:hypothetical protein